VVGGVGGDPLDARMLRGGATAGHDLDLIAPAGQQPSRGGADATGAGDHV
jgi:hypothetical protein